jgi:hypothetical protein
LDPGWLLLSEKWYPGWMFRYPGETEWRPVEQGNLAFIAVPVVAAEYIEYRPWWKWPALAASAASLLAAVVLVVVRGRRPR